MKNLLKLAKVQGVSVGSVATVMEAIEAMSKASVGAVMVVDGEELKGVFTERDVMLRVVLEKKDPNTTSVSDVMTSPVVSINKEKTTVDAVLKTMSERHIRHLPVLSDGKVEGVISIRHLLQHKVENLTNELDSLEAYISADGIGG
jgi:CBS domain-containing protein